MPMRNIEARVTGIVQGVGYRVFVKNTADSLGIFGTVRNLEDGSVFLTASGKPETIEKFLGILKTGHETASVENIEVKDTETVFSGVFSILKTVKTRN